MDRGKVGVEEGREGELGLLCKMKSKFFNEKKNRSRDEGIQLSCSLWTSAGTSASQLTATLTHHKHQFLLQNFSPYLFIHACMHPSIMHFPIIYFISNDICYQFWSS